MFKRQQITSKAQSVSLPILCANRGLGTAGRPRLSQLSGASLKAPSPQTQKESKQNTDQPPMPAETEARQHSGFLACYIRLDRHQKNYRIHTLTERVDTSGFDKCSFCKFYLSKFCINKCIFSKDSFSKFSFSTSSFCEFIFSKFSISGFSFDKFSFSKFSVSKCQLSTVANSALASSTLANATSAN